MEVSCVLYDLFLCCTLASKPECAVRRYETHESFAWRRNQCVLCVAIRPTKLRAAFPVSPVNVLYVLFS